jgi:ribosome-associated protein
MARRPAPHRGIDTERPDPADGEGPSKTALKQQSHALQALGLQLAELPEQRLAATPMPDALRERSRNGAAPVRTKAGGARCSTSAS